MKTPFPSPWRHASSLAACLGLAALHGLVAPAALADPPAATRDGALSPAQTPNRIDAPPTDAVRPAAAPASVANAAPSVSETPPTQAPAAGGPTPELPPAIPASPLATALEAALDATTPQDFKTDPIGAGDWRGALDAIRAFYATRAYEPVWVAANGLTPAGVAALSRLMRADEDGLDLSSLALPKPPLTDATPERLAQAEAVLSEAVVAYAMQASGSRLVPIRISPLITAHPTVASPAAALATVAGAPDADAALQAFNPQQKGYAELRDQLARLAPETATTLPPPIASGPSLAIGMVDPRVPEVRKRLGVAAPPIGKDPLAYDLRTAVAVAAFQRASGLPATGALTPATVEGLSGGAVSSGRRALILANMEMWRWEPRAMGEQRIEINIPDYTLRLMDGDTLVHEARVIVGKPDTPTPVFSNQVRYLLVNPIWRVPDSIIKKEMEPKLAQDPDYLTRHGYEVTQIGDHLVVRQPPGEGNALGRILFMFPNEHAVYLHDTPGRALFASARRDFSHGCVRVEQPMRLAELVMGGAASGWSLGRLEGMLGKAERTVPLPHTIPIHLEYFTEFVDDSGALQDREDVYGIARRVAGAMTRTSQD